MRPPLLFLHGASCNGDVWRQGFLAGFEQAGYDCHVLDLPGHRGKPVRASLDQLGLSDYVAALREAASALPAPPVLIGHSMGGYLSQRYVLEGGQAAGLVLLAAAPPQGMARELVNFAVRHPLLAMSLSLRPSGTTPLPVKRRRTRALVCTRHTPDETVAWMTDHMRPESARAIRELGREALPARPLPLPVCVHGGQQDVLVSTSAVRSTARAYGVPARIHPHMAHMLQLEPGWDTVAREVLDFLPLCGQGLPRNR